MGELLSGESITGTDVKTAVSGTSGVGEWYSVLTAAGFLFAGSR